MEPEEYLAQICRGNWLGKLLTESDNSTHIENSVEPDQSPN